MPTIRLLVTDSGCYLWVSQDARLLIAVQSREYSLKRRCLLDHMMAGLYTLIILQLSNG